LKTIVISNRKGGTAKTTTTVNLAGELAKTSSVLLIDLDTLGHSSIGLGQTPQESGGVHQIFNGKTISQTLLPSSINNLTLSPASTFFDVYEQKDLSGILKRQFIKEELSEFFDYCVIDTPPTYDGILKNALEVCDCVIIPTIPHYLGFIGVEQVFRSIYQMTTQFRDKAPLVGILPVMYNTHIEEHNKTIKKIKNSFGEDKLFSPIGIDINLATSFEKGIPLTLEDTSKRGGKDYKIFTKELIGRINGK
jgi:chromosome partitioning protein